MNPESNNQNSGEQSEQQQNPTQSFSVSSNSTILGVLSYLGPLVVISYMMGKNDEFVKFHAKQGLVLFGIEVVMMFVSSYMFLWMIGGLINLATLVLSIIGIVNVIQGKKNELPVIGSLAKSLKF